MICRRNSAASVRHLTHLIVAFAMLIGVSNHARSETEGALGASSYGSADVYFVILQAPRFTTPSNFFENAQPIEPARSGLSASASTSIEMNSASRQNFDLSEPDARNWLNDQLSKNGQATLEICIPEGQGEIGLLESQSAPGGNRGAMSNDEHTLTVEFSSGGGDDSPNANQGCSGSMSTKVNIFMASHRSESPSAEKVAGVEESQIDDETLSSLLLALLNGEDLGEAVEPTAAGATMFAPAEDNEVLRINLVITPE